MICNLTKKPQIPDDILNKLVKSAARFIKVDPNKCIIAFSWSKLYFDGVFNEQYIQTFVGHNKLTIPFITILIPKNELLYKSDYSAEELWEYILHELCHLKDFIDNKGVADKLPGKRHKNQPAEIAVANILNKKGITDIHYRHSLMIDLPIYVFTSIHNIKQWFLHNKVDLTLF